SRTPNSMHRGLQSARSLSPEERAVVEMFERDEELRTYEKLIRDSRQRKHYTDLGGFLTLGDGTKDDVERTAAPVAQPIGVAASPEIACEAIVCVAAGWSRR